jgi:hypothetical protein
MMNNKEFDKELQKHIKTMLEIAWEYIYSSKKIDNIFIYLLIGKEKYFDIVYQVENKYFERHKIYLIDSNYVVTDEHQEWLIKNIMNERSAIELLFKSFEREVPFEIKIIYSPKLGNLDVKFGYDNPIKNNNSAIGDGFRAWIKSLGVGF